MRTLYEERGYNATTSEDGASANTFELMANNLFDRDLQILPRIMLLPQAIYVNGLKIPMGRRPVMVKLFETFLKHPLHSFSADELTRFIYSNSPCHQMSPRRRMSLQQNIVKLISRARDHANRAVNVENGIWIEWFPYFADEERWAFYRLSSHYLAAKELQMQVERSRRLH